MAIDTRSKRASALAALRSWLLAPIFPDGTVSQGDRQHAAYMYAGILASAPAVIGEVPDRLSFLARQRSKAFVVPQRSKVFLAPEREKEFQP